MRFNITAVGEGLALPARVLYAPPPPSPIYPSTLVKNPDKILQKSPLTLAIR